MGRSRDDGFGGLGREGRKGEQVRSKDLLICPPRNEVDRFQIHFGNEKTPFKTDLDRV